MLVQSEIESEAYSEYLEKSSLMKFLVINGANLLSRGSGLNPLL